MKLARPKLALVALGLALCPALLIYRARGSDHADTPAIAATPGGDLTDVFIFPSPSDSSKVVLVMDVHPLIASGQVGSVVFDPNILYQFKIDTNGDNVEDKVIQFKFTGTTPSTQTVQVAGPITPSRTGTTSVFEAPNSTSYPFNQTSTIANGAKVFCGPREDPFFFDLIQFYTIFPDRANPLGPTVVNTAGQTVSTTPSNPNAPQATSWRSQSQAVDYLAGFNVLSIVIELPKSQLGTGVIGVWCTTSR